MAAVVVVVGLQRQYLHAVAGDGDMDDILFFFTWDMKQSKQYEVYCVSIGT